MPNPQNIKGPMGHIIDPGFLNMDFDAAYNAISRAAEAAKDKQETYGFHLWQELLEGQPNLVQLDQTIDRLPPNAFGTVSPNYKFAIAVHMWATHDSPGLIYTSLVFKEKMLMAGWKPSQVNAHLVARSHMREKTGGAEVSYIPLNFDEFDFSDLPPRYLQVVEDMKRAPAFIPSAER